MPKTTLFALLNHVYSVLAQAVAIGMADQAMGKYCPHGQLLDVYRAHTT